MKKTLFYALSAALAFSASAESVPYKSDIGLGSTFALDPAWANINRGNRRANGFVFDRPDQTNFSTPGTTGGMVHSFDTDYAANCWLISPAIELTGGTEYTVSVWTKTEGADNEAFKITAGTGQTVEDQTEILLDKPSYSHASDFEKQTVNYTPAADGSYCFGFHCYSDEFTNNFHVTGFTIKEAGAEDPDPQPVDPPQEARELPFEYSFTDAAAFVKDWTSRAGEGAYSNNPWSINEYSGWAEFDRAYGEKENNWLISPELNFTEAGNYMLMTTGMIQGRLEYLIGTDPDDLTTFTKFGEFEDNEYGNDNKHDFPFTVTEPGKYRIAIRACAESGTYMGYRVKSVKVKVDKPVPAIVTDLTAEADRTDALKVTLRWTNPATDQAGNTLPAISKIEVYRNGEMIKELTECTPGIATSYTDTPDKAGVYTYYVLAYNENGAHDAEPTKASSGFVGYPTTDVPFVYNANYDDAVTPMFTMVDANGDGVKWYFDDSWSYSKTFKIKADEITELDDYLITPYMTLQPGYYSFTHDISARYNNFEAGYVTDRHHPSATFHAIHVENDFQDYSLQDMRYLLVIDEPTEIALAIHAFGLSSNPAYLDMTVVNFGLEAAPLVPGAVTNLTAAEAEADGAKAVQLTWTNPTVDNAGRDLTADMQLTLTVKRDGETITTLTGQPGTEGSYTDEAIEGLTQAIYTVETANAAGPSEADSPKATIYLGALTELPYSCTEFADWNLINTGTYYNQWTRDEVDGTLVWSKYWDNGEDFALSPFFMLEDGGEYTAKTTLCNEGTEELPVSLVSATIAAEGYTTVVDSYLLTTADSQGTEFTTVFRATAAEAEAEETEAKPVVAPGKVAIGIGADLAGTLRITAFSLEKKEVDGTVSTVIATTGSLTYAAGKVHASAEADFTVFDATGRTLLTGHGTELDLTALRGVIMVTARTADGHTATIKVIR